MNDVRFFELPYIHICTIVCAVYKQEVIKIDYTKLKCEICDEQFIENDDVVVCPDCGTPAHRVCWKKNGKCPNENKHSENFVFNGFDLIKKSAQGVKEKSEDKSDKIKIISVPSCDEKKVCSVCGNKNDLQANFCNRCGSKLTETNSQNNYDFADYGEFQLPPGMPDPLGGVPAKAQFEDGITAADMACYVAVNTPYYMRAFNAVKRKENKFNLSAAVFSGVWFFFRKQYKVGALVFSIETLLYVLRFYISSTFSINVINGVLDKLGLSIENMSSFTMEQYMNMSVELQKLPVSQQIITMLPGMIMFAQIIGMIILGVFANKIYYKHCIDKIRILKNTAAQENLSKAETAKLLNYSGGVNMITTGFLLLVYLFMMFN